MTEIGRKIIRKRIQLHDQDIISESSEEYESSDNTSSINKERNLSGPKKEIASNNFSWIFICLAALLVLLICKSFPFSYSDKNIALKTCSFNQIKTNYMDQTTKYFWNSLSAGIEGTLNDEPTKPTTFLFLYNDTALAQRLVANIVEETESCFDKLPSVKYNTEYFNSEDFSKDYGIIIVDIQKKLKDGGVLLIVDLDKVPAKAARSLHSVCDVYSPLIQKLIVFMTLKSFDFEVTPKKAASETLKARWQSLSSAELYPLLSRVTEQVLWLPKT